jgi:hypothetical protein
VKDTEFDAIVGQIDPSIHDQAVAVIAWKKGQFLDTLKYLMFFTWAVLIVPVACLVWGAAF